MERTVATGIAGALAARWRAAPSTTVLRDADGRRHSATDLLDAMSGLATSLADHVVVAVALPNGVVAAVATLAAMGVAACAPVDPGLPSAAALDHLAAVRATALVGPRGDAAWRAVAEAAGIAWVEVDDDLGSWPVAAEPAWRAGADPALLLRTSGTTGRPKLVRLSNDNLLASAGAVAATLELGPADRGLNVMPLFHIHGIVAGLLASLLVGAEVICTPGVKGAPVVDWLRRHRPTWYTAVPTIHQAILDAVEVAAPPAGGWGLRFVRSSSASMPGPLLERIEARLGTPVIEAYGMTEAAHQMTSNRLPPAERLLGSVGSAAGPEVRILTGGRIHADPLIAGEVVVRGPGVTAGYADDDAATAAAFVDGWFRTGDLGALDHAGRLRLVGRSKEQINRGGEKVSPREVDDALLSHPSVRQAVAFAVPHARLGEDVAAAVVLHETDAAPVGPDALRAHTREHLPPSHVPSSVVIVDQIPTGPTGKVQRVGLAAALGLGAIEAVVVDERLTPRQAAIAGLMARVVGSLPSLDDEFNRLGGDSLGLAELLVDIGEVLGVHLELDALIDGPVTVRAIAAATATPQPASSHAPGPGAAGDLTPTEARLLFVSDLDDGGSLYNTGVALAVDVALDVDVLRRAVACVVTAHDALRTSFPLVHGERRRQVTPADATSAPEIRLLAVAPDAVEETAHRLMAEAFDLATGPLVRVALLEHPGGGSTLVLVAHHAITDGHGHDIIVRDLAAAYDALVDGRAPAPSTSSMAAAVAELRTAAVTGRVDELAEAAAADLADAPTVLDLLPDLPVPADPTGAGSVAVGRFGPATLAAVRATAAQHGATPFAVLLTAVGVVLGRRAGVDDLVLGVPVDQRTSAARHDTVGLLINTLAVRVDLRHEPSVAQALTRVATATARAVARQDIPFERLVDALGAERRLGRNPLVQAMVQLRPPWATEVPIGGTVLHRLPIRTPVARVDLAFELTDEEDGLGVVLEYSTELFDPETAARLITQLEATTRAICEADPDQALADIDIADDAERALLRSWSVGRPLPPVSATVVEGILAQAKQTPDAPALFDATGSSTYAQLGARVDEVADALAAALAPGTLVGLAMDRTRDAIAVLLGIMAAGLVYVPLDPEWPTARLAAVLAECGATVVVADQILDLGTVDATLLTADALRGAPRRTAGPMLDELAYVIHTSGSTGRPKGVEVSHRSLASFLAALSPWFPASARRSGVAAAAFTFDMSWAEVLLPLLDGGRLVVVHDALDLVDGLPAPVTAVQTVPSLVRQLLRLDAIGPEVEVVFVGGEQLEPDVVDGVLRHGARLLNFYGPTEATGSCMAWEATPPFAHRRSLIGRPHPGCVVAVLDGRGRLAPVGAVGEIVIGGGQLARGYRNRPDRTADAFVACPDLGLGVDRIYRTGDRGRWLASGQMEYLGRADGQVKVRGRRVELGEVEAALRAGPGVVDACAALVGEGVEQVLGAVVVGAEPEVAERAAAARLPAGLVPGVVRRVDALPRNESGKVDRGAAAALLATPGPAPALRPRPAVAEGGFEAAMLDVWRRLLRRPSVGVDDDFFDAGGQSLLAAVMVAEVDEQLGRRIPIREMFTGPATIRRLASLVEPGSVTASMAQGVLTQVSDDGPQPPLFVLWAAPSQRFVVRHLLPVVGTDRAVWHGVAGPYLGQDPRPASVEAIATRFGDAIRAVQPHGPYHLLGHSLGGLGAFQTAIDLTAVGERVAFLGLMDTTTARARGWATLDRRVRLRLREIPVVGPAVRKRIGAGPHEAWEDPAAPEAFDRVAARAVTDAYRDRGYAGRIDLFKGHRRQRIVRVTDLGWRLVRTGRLAVHEIPANHIDMLRPPHVDALAVSIQAALDAVDPPG